MKTLLFILALTTISNTYAQTNDSIKIKDCIDVLFTSMANGDSSAITTIVTSNARLSTVYFHPQKGTKVIETSMNEFKTVIGTPHKEKWEERYNDFDINIDGPLAHVWMNYSFYLDDKLSHCGVNCFTMVNENGTWKIYAIIDTRHRDNCN